MEGINYKQWIFVIILAILFHIPQFIWWDKIPAIHIGIILIDVLVVGFILIGSIIFIWKKLE